MSPVLCRTPLLPLGGRQGCGWLRAGHARTQAHTHVHIHPHRRAHTHAHAHACTHTECSARTCAGPCLSQDRSWVTRARSGSPAPGPFSPNQASHFLWPVLGGQAGGDVCGERERLSASSTRKALPPTQCQTAGSLGAGRGLRRQPSLRACCHGVSTSSTGGRSRLTAEMTSLSPSSLPCPAR